MGLAELKPEVYDPLTCSECGIRFWVPSHWCQARRGNHRGFKCPNGCGQYFPDESEEEKLRRKLRDAKSSLELSQRRQREVLEEKREADLKLEKLKKRVRNGVCPCCKRSFQNLRRHMATKHPEAK